MTGFSIIRPGFYCLISNIRTRSLILFDCCINYCISFLNKCHLCNNMSLWVDKCRPNTIGKLTLHPDVNSKLQALSLGEELPHLLFYGPPGAGKKTRVMALLREIYGSGVEKIKLEHRTFKTASGKPIEIGTIGSNYHIECNPSDVGNNDRFVIQEVIKEIASHGNLSSSAAPGSRSFKIVLLTEVDRLSKQAQAGLRRTMEKYSSQCRIILMCNSPSKIIEPVRSRCLSIRIPAPSHDDISQLLIQVAKRESCQCPMELAMKISLQSDRNVRRAVMMLEAARVQVAPSSQMIATQVVQLPDWEIYVTKLAREIMAEQTPSKLLQAREMLYELLVNCIPPDVIMQTLVNELLKALDDELKHEVVYWAAYYEHRMCQGSKDIFHLEAFVAKFMAVYKKWLIALFG